MYSEYILGVHYYTQVGAHFLGVQVAANDRIENSISTLSDAHFSPNTGSPVQTYTDPHTHTPTR